MMVTFVSQCEKKALNRTRRVLDAFANRIGDNTWQTVITQEGLLAVKKLLRKTASKSTAVSCHWIRSRARSELVWVVGRRDKFNGAGVVPVNHARQNILKTHNEGDWHFLPIIKSLTVFAALLHDFGKTSTLFQKKLKGKTASQSDPLRHEWVSVLFLLALVDGQNDETWLSNLVCDTIHQKIKKLNIVNTTNPLGDLPPIATLLAWLILSHHKLPLKKEFNAKGKNFTLNDLMAGIDGSWGYENTKEQMAFSDWFKYTELPSQSLAWQNEIKTYATTLKAQSSEIAPLIENNGFRAILHYSRLCLMLGDHFYSSCPEDTGWHSDINLYANTDGNNQLKQKLDEHLVKVAMQAKRNVNKLPEFEGVFNRNIRTEDKKELRKSTKGYEWQETAVAAIKKWKKSEPNIDKNQYGLFAVNMASTGKGKTFANAKIMQALSADEESLRYILALGLRTLTLQTGDEYKEKIGLSKEELAVLIGSKAVLNLHNQSQVTATQSNEEQSGSESSESLNDNEVIFSADFPEQGLDTVLNKLKDRQFLYAPVLVCTIDHIIQATETKRGGRYILPTLRLMSSDLVIDEIDDFDGEDLIAIGRLIHLAGMLGRKVMISSATIPPDLAEGYFNAYHAGWKHFAQMRNKSLAIGCMWVDEFTTRCYSISDTLSYAKKHQKFITKRIERLDKEPVRRKVNIAHCGTEPSNYFDDIRSAILEKHQHHHFMDEQSGKTLSIGVVRMANVDPCIDFTDYLLAAGWPDQGAEIKAMAFHSRQVLLMRHAQEKYLDKVLKRKEGDQHILNDAVIRHHIDSSTAQHIIFVVVATPVEEVGRDHDFDWAVIEPSSYRSFIQMAGRVLRHRDKVITEPNVAIMKYNYRALKEQCNPEKPAFIWPGYERGEDDLTSHNMEKLVNTAELAEKLDATRRIQKSDQSELASLEHKVIHEHLTNYEAKGAETLQGWIDSHWWLTAMPQQLTRFRRNNLNDPTVYLTLDEGFVEKSDKGNSVPVMKDNVKFPELDNKQMNNLWLKREYDKLLIEQAEGGYLKATALIYGEINIPLYGADLTNQQFTYNPQLGLARAKSASEIVK